MEKEIEIVTCLICSKSFNSANNLRRHIRKCHPNEKEYLSSLCPQNNKTYNYSCEHCNRQFSHLRNLTYHMKTHDEQFEYKEYRTHQCALCDYCHNKRNVIKHYQQSHNIPIVENEMKFDSQDQFYKWKENFEKETNSSYVIRHSDIGKTKTRTSFNCNRSGKYVSKTKNLRLAKKVGTNKINALCPANIQLYTTKEGNCTATIVDTHVGHENDIKHLYLSKSERDELAKKISSNVPFGKILEDIQQTRSETEAKRLDLINRQDLHNIKAALNLTSPLEENNVSVKVLLEVKEEPLNFDSVLSTSCLEEEKNKLKTHFLEFMENISFRIDQISSQNDLDVMKDLFVKFNNEMISCCNQESSVLNCVK